MTVDSSSTCPPSSCGIINHISFPFRLKTDPPQCGYSDPSFVLDCLDNQTVATADSQTYIVQEINYQNYMIRLVPPGLIPNLSSCPLNRSMGYDIDEWPLSAGRTFVDVVRLNQQVWFVHCLTPITSPKYIKAAFCGNTTSLFSNSSQINSYVVVGDMPFISELEETCILDRITMVSSQTMITSLATIYDALGYGFDLTWVRVYCGKCNGDEYCRIRGNQLQCTRCGFKCELDLWLERHRLAISRAIGIPILLRFLIGFSLLIWLVVGKWRKRHLSTDESIEEFLQSQNNITPIKYTYLEIKKMTNNFKLRLGEGGYGIVYKGKLRSGPDVAVKIMGQSVAREQDFISEVGTIGRIHHANVVKLIGFCVEGSKYALVYEFLSNGSLDRYIFNQQSLDARVLKYEKMFEIALGIAHGIAYLHHGCDMQILHFDIKPHNILLDENFNPKISDFGLAKTKDNVFSLTSARGTMGYMAPEMFYQNIGGVSYKADVYSFGMLLMEMVGKRKNMNPFAEDVSQIYFPYWVYDQLKVRNEIDIEDATKEEREMIKRMIIVALWCIQIKPSDRPTMDKVVEMLGADYDVQMPPKPFVAPHEIANRDDEIVQELECAL